jgi:hypothetical protein
MRTRDDPKRIFHFQYELSRSRSFLSVDSIVSGRVSPSFVLCGEKFPCVNEKSNMAMDGKSFHRRISEPSVAIRCLNVISCACWLIRRRELATFRGNFMNFCDFFASENLPCVGKKSGEREPP